LLVTLSTVHLSGWNFMHHSFSQCPNLSRSFCRVSASLFYYTDTAGNRHKQNSWFCKEIREDNFRFWWRRVHEDASQGMYMSKIEIFFFTARILQNQRMLCCGECFHD
jgi:hypothetical protein